MPLLSVNKAMKIKDKEYNWNFASPIPEGSGFTASGSGVSWNMSHKPISSHTASS